MSNGFAQFSYSSAKVRRVKHMQFGVLSPNELKAMSVAHINKPDLSVNGVPVPGGLEDMRLGTCDYHATCKTCKCTYTGGGMVQDCPGHFGHIELAKPVYHIGFLGVVLNLLNCVCINCSQVLVDRNDTRVREALRHRNPKKRLGAILKIARSKSRCETTNPPTNEDGSMDTSAVGRQGCGHPQPRYIRDGFKMSLQYSERAEVAGEKKRLLSAEEVHGIFKNISDADCRLLGLNPVFARPDWLLCTVIPVPPPHVRPAVALDNLRRSQDDLTFKLADIIKANTGLRNSLQKGEPSTIVQEYETLLQYHVATFVDNQLPGQPQAKQRGGKTLKTIRQRLVGKGGRVRQNLMGKRVDFSARTVITADPNLSIDRVGVPRSIAANLTIPERVTRFNVERLQRLISNGPYSHPGAKYIIHEDGNRIDLRFVSNRNDMNLRQGWIVERHLADGDYVLFNRQPSLHKMSIMCHRVKVMDYSTFRLNLTCTSPYNADFDGDEMNLHALQTLPAIAEARELMITPRLIVSAQSNKPVMGIVQDTLLGVQKMTKRDVLIEKWKMMNMVMWQGDVWDGKIPAPAVMVRKKGSAGPGSFTPYWTGKQLLSMIIPDVNVTLKSSTAPDDAPSLEELFPGDTKVVVDRGQLIQGIVDKKTLGKSAGGLIHVIMNDMSPFDARDFINNVQRMVNYWLHNRGFSIGIADAEADKETMVVISNTIVDAKKNVQNLVEKGQRGKMKTQPGSTLMQSFEKLVNAALNQAREQAGKRAASALDETNAVRAMVSAGSKGSNINIAQIIACVGQQNVEGGRIPCRFQGRSLPHFCKDDLGPESRGFVENSYLKGLTPEEFFFHMMGGREGLIDTAVKTAETGYIQRRLVKAMEDISVRYDGTVRNSEGIVIQFLYGEDGMDGRWVEFQKLESFNLDARKFAKLYEFNPDHPRFGHMKNRPDVSYLLPSVIDEMKNNIEVRTLLEEEIHQLQKDRVIIETILRSINKLDQPKAPLPVNLRRLILNAQKKFKTDLNKPSDLSPPQVIRDVRRLLDDLVVVAGDDTLSNEAQENATTLFCILARSVLASKRVTREFRLSSSAFDWVLAEIKTKFMNAMVNSGEMCGVLAAQSMGEPATQMTLNTFHYAGVSAKNVTLGVPRLKELINISKKVKTPSLMIFLSPRLRYDEDAVKKMRSVLEYTTLRDITRTTEIYYDPDPHNSVVELDREWLESALLDDDEDDAEKDVVLSPWLLRMELDPTRKAGFPFEVIEERILAKLSQLHVVYNDDNADNPTLRMRIKYTRAEKEALDMDELAGGETEDDILKSLENTMLSTLKLGGIDDIMKFYTHREKTQVWAPGTGNVLQEEWVVDTDGTNLLEVLSHPDVDPTRTRSNDIVEVLGVLGIEAVRGALLFELRNVMEFDGSYVNYRHLGILVDTMTARGFLTAITRHGINRVDNGPLQRASFEETCEIYMDAAAFAEDDGLNGVTENLMLGQLCPMGTGTFDLVLDEERLKEALEFKEVSYGEGGGEGGGSDGTPLREDSPEMVSPVDSGAFTPLDGDTAFSPGPQFTPGAMSPGGMSPGAQSPYGGGDAGYGSQSPDWLPQSPGMGSTTPGYGAASPGFEEGYSPSSPAYGSAQSPGYSPTSPGYSPTSPGYSPTSPGYSPTSPGYSPTSPGYSPTSPGYSPTSPGYSPTSPGYSPTSPGYSPTSPGYSPTSPGYSPTSPGYSPTSPGYSPTSPAMSPASPAYSPTSPAMSPASPAYSPTSPSYGPSGGMGGASPSYSPSSPQYSPASPSYSPSSPQYSPNPGSSATPTSGTGYSPSDGSYSPQTSPGAGTTGGYSPNQS